VTLLEASQRHRRETIAVTQIKQVENRSTERLMFINLEDSGHNRYLDPGSFTKIDCPVPWCGGREEWLKKPIIVMKVAGAQALGFIWENRETEKLYLSKNDFQTGKEYYLPVRSDPGGDINLIVTKELTVEGRGILVAGDVAAAGQTG
jgi:hypothetical protein